MAGINSNIREILKSAKNIAVVGLSDSPYRTSNSVSRYIQSAGYNIIPVNPKCSEVLGKKCYPALADVPEEIDIVNVFRRPEFVAGVIDEAIAVGAKVVWLQLGVVDEQAAQKALDAGLQVVMDRCIKVEHMYL
jgi:predicted CoA-binding protein